MSDKYLFYAAIIQLVLGLLGVIGGVYGMVVDGLTYKWVITTLFGIAFFLMGMAGYFNHKNK